MDKKIKVLIFFLSLMSLFVITVRIYAIASELHLGMTVGKEGTIECLARYRVDSRWVLQVSAPWKGGGYLVSGLYMPETVSSGIINPYIGVGYSSKGDDLLRRTQVMGGINLPLDSISPDFSFSVDMRASSEGTFVGVSFLLRLGNGKPSDEDLVLLARLITAEAEGQPFDGKVAVGAVVLNRVRDPRFPNTIREVIYQPGQFMPVSDGRINIVEPTETSYAAARAALAGQDPSHGALYFYNPAKATPAGLRFMATRTITVRIGDHIFCK